MSFTPKRSLCSGLYFLLGVTVIACSLQVLPPAVSKGYSSSSYDVSVQVGKLSQSLISAYPEGTRFAIAPGVYRLSGPLFPKRGQQFLGSDGAILNGSKVLTDWIQDGSLWYVEGQTQRLPILQDFSVRIVTPESPMANQAEDVFFDNEPFFQVDSLQRIGPGKFYFDYRNSRIYLANNPNGHTVETTRVPQAFTGEGSDVLIKNLIIEKFGNRAQTGAIHSTGSGWKVENCEVRLNHGVGIRLGDGGIVKGCHVHHQGQMGLAGSGQNLVVEDNEIAFNNTAGYNSYWEAGGAKWVYCTNLEIRNNWAHDNAGPGLWTDIHNLHTLYEGNKVEQNERSGIMHEISYDAIIRNNTIRHNGTNYKDWEVEGAGINLTRSQNVEVYGNIVSGNAAGIVLCHDPRNDSDTRGNYIHDNTIQMSRGYTGILLAGDNDDTSVFFQKNNRFVNNRYEVTDLIGSFWEWEGSKTWSQWQGLGQDSGGVLGVFTSK